VQQIRVEPVEDWVALGHRWQALESAADGGFFQSWAFLGCLAEARFKGATLLSVTAGGDDLALALLGTGAGRSWLNETGDAVADSVFIEHNGMLLRRGHEPVLGQALAHAVRVAGPVVLSGVNTATLAAVQRAGWLELRQTRFAPSIDLTPPGGDFLATLSGNTRAQIRRSMRLFGPDLQLTRATTQLQAHAFFEEMVALHQTAWKARGRPGAFAEHSVKRFHATLIDRAWPLGHIDLLRIAAGGRHIGTLYMFLHHGRVMNYQSGFNYGGDTHEKPGLVSHALAIQFYAENACRVYDLLAGDGRYKRSLAKGGETLHWAVLHPGWRKSGLLAKARGALKTAQALVTQAKTKGK
jgi:hypothetical protein